MDHFSRDVQKFCDRKASEMISISVGDWKVENIDSVNTNATSISQTNIAGFAILAIKLIIWSIPPVHRNKEYT